MTLFVQIIYVLITVVLILVVLLQAGRGGGLGTALGGGASQTVFGGSGGADFLAKLTQGLAIGFMVCAVYLAYASAHSGSDRLKDESEKLAAENALPEDDSEVNYEFVGPNPRPLPPAGARPSAPAPGKAAAPAPTDDGDAAPEQPADADLEPAATGG
ncbi:MAG: preprotein translocase subunit SecG [Deltaproteobacteria bacterium]|nr:preprotein translocase subunit SecG [Deltaproteobacteria bacterium]MBK8237753.1 preprotein translocase subunit SecG [Deltaproteobacteria bacterium]MBP7289072.1 preprotein translocase subunit SecG [Nannocystaceae bacterium]